MATHKVPEPEVGQKYRALTTTNSNEQTVTVEVTKVASEGPTGWYVWGYRQYKNRRNGVRQTAYPRMYFVPRASCDHSRHV